MYVDKCILVPDITEKLFQMHLGIDKILVGRWMRRDGEIEVIRGSAHLGPRYGSSLAFGEYFWIFVDIFQSRSFLRIGRLHCLLCSLVQCVCWQSWLQ